MFFLQLEFEEVVPEQEDVLDTAVWIDNDKMILNYVKDVKDVVQVRAAQHHGDQDADIALAVV